MRLRVTTPSSPVAFIAWPRPLSFLAFSMNLPPAFSSYAMCVCFVINVVHCLPLFLEGRCFPCLPLSRPAAVGFHVYGRFLLPQWRCGLSSGRPDVLGCSASVQASSAQSPSQVHSGWTGKRGNCHLHRWRPRARSFTSRGQGDVLQAACGKEAAPLAVVLSVMPGIFEQSF